MLNLPKVGLDALRIQDSQQLKNALLNCDDPMKAISDFQEENCILLPTLKPALNLIDLHNVRRLEFHMSIADELRDQLTKRVEDLASVINLNVAKEIQNSEETKKLEELLEKSFPLIK
jgi:negative elongation factor B